MNCPDQLHPMKFAVIYHYFEKVEIYKDNLVFFLSAALH